MIRSRIGLITLVFAGVLGVLAQNIGSGSGEIKMTAKKYEFSPNIVRIKKGDHVRLVITAIDRAHGFEVDAFQINQKLPKGEAVTVDFRADRSGTFPFQCSDFCGLGHKKMKGELIIE
jgi:heme/copper-type cytochrome/quinol oxidase subunit 2